MGAADYEPGPLTPMDPAELFVPRRATTFQELVTDYMQSSGDNDAVLATAREQMVEFPGQPLIDDQAGGLLDSAGEAHAATMQALDGEDAADLIDASAAQSHESDVRGGSYDEPPPPDAVVEDPGDPPFPDGDKPAPDF